MELQNRILKPQYYGIHYASSRAPAKAYLSVLLEPCGNKVQVKNIYVEKNSRISLEVWFIGINMKSISKLSYFILNPFLNKYLKTNITNNLSTNYKKLPLNCNALGKLL